MKKIYKQKVIQYKIISDYGFSDPIPCIGTITKTINKLISNVANLQKYNIYDINLLVLMSYKIISNWKVGVNKNIFTLYIHDKYTFVRKIYGIIEFK